jgi:hypothetical protein
MSTTDDILTRLLAQEHVLVCREAHDLIVRLTRPMNADLVKRLREYDSGLGYVTVIDSLTEEAADGLVSLRAEVERLKAGLEKANDIATEIGNDERHTAGERTGARMVGAQLRAMLAAAPSAPPQVSPEGEAE